MSNRCSDGRCGAEDCERCHPGCSEPTECCSCGAGEKQYITIECDHCGNPVCPDCAVDGMCPACHQTSTDEATLARATTPRVGDVFVWRDSRVTVKCVAADGTVGALLECENRYSDFTMTAAGWRDSVARTLAHDGVTFTPVLDTASAGVVQCAT